MAIGRSEATTSAGVAPARISAQRVALWIVLFQLAWNWRRIVPLLTQGAMPDTDDFMRLAEVRAWMGGQGWYDLVQHRMDPPLGADMHWSRLVDVPIAALVGFFDLFTDTVMAERLAAIVWPTLLLVAAVLAILQVCRSVASDFHPLLAVMFTVTCVPALGEFAPGRIDHHSVQILCFCLTLLGLANPGRWWGHLLVGATIAASISVGLDAVLLAVLVLAWLGVEWAFDRDPGGRGLVRAGAGLAATALLLYPLNFPPSRWLETRCDANSAVYLSALLSIAAAFWLLALLSPRLAGASVLRTAAMRAAAGAVLAGVIMAALYRLYPQCASGPYGALSEELAGRWLVQINEAMGLFARIGEYPQLFFPGVVHSLILLAIGAVVVWRHARQRPAIVALYAALALSILSTLIQYRAMRIGILASVPLCVIFVGMAWDWLKTRLSGSRLPAMALQGLVVLLVLSPTWYVVGAVAFPEAAHQPPADAAADATAPAWKKQAVYAMCNEQDQYAVLASLPTGLVMSDVNSGPPVLVFTRQPVVGGPYHRNERAILDMLDFFETDLEKPERIAAARGIEYVAWCDPGDLTGSGYDANPALAVRLARGNPPDWLEALSPAGDRLQVYRVRR